MLCALRTVWYCCNEIGTALLDVCHIYVLAVLCTAISVLTFSCLVCLTRLDGLSHEFGAVHAEAPNVVLIDIGTNDLCNGCSA